MRFNRAMIIILTLTCVALFSTGIDITIITLVDDAHAQEAVEVNVGDNKPIDGVLSQMTSWIWAKHHEFKHSLTREMQKLRGQDGIGWTLVLVSFLYGVLHAAGPGHGKIVLTTYLLTHGNQLRRGVSMGVLAALLQGVTAVVLVYGLVLLAGWIPGEAESASIWAARLSFVLVAIVGLYLFVKASKVLLGSIRNLNRLNYSAHHDHDHDHDCGGCKHMPSVTDINAGDSKQAFAGIVFSIGLRPCSGAVLVLILAATLDLTWHGAFAVLAMSVGTAITIVVLALIATKAREWTSSMVAYQSPFWSIAAGSAGVFGGGLILFFGLWLLTTSFAL